VELFDSSTLRRPSRHGAGYPHINLSKFETTRAVRTIGHLYYSNKSIDLSPFIGDPILIKLGLHVSITGTIDQSADRARELGCQTFQLFTRNPRGWKFRKLDADEAGEFKRKVQAYGLEPAVAHMPYLPNLSSPKKAIYNKSVKSLAVELDRCAILGIPYVVTHLGSHLGKGLDVGLENIGAAVNYAISKNKGNTILLLENMAGTKNSMGSSFEDIRRILDRVKNRERVGVCFDTAHAFAAGYDLRTPEKVNETIAKFDSIIGLKLLRVIHLNDSKGDLGSGRDRHEHIGLGYIGEGGFKALFQHQALRGIPFIMETPIDEEGDDLRDIERVRKLSQ
jgi:deoxyribonuclease-4